MGSGVVDFLVPRRIQGGRQERTQITVLGRDVRLPDLGSRGAAASQLERRDERIRAWRHLALAFGVFVALTIMLVLRRTIWDWQGGFRGWDIIFEVPWLVAFACAGWNVLGVLISWLLRNNLNREALVRLLGGWGAFVVVELAVSPSFLLSLGWSSFAIKTTIVTVSAFGMPILNCILPYRWSLVLYYVILRDENDSREHIAKCNREENMVYFFFASVYAIKAFGACV